MKVEKLERIQRANNYDSHKWTAVVSPEGDAEVVCIECDAEPWMNKAFEACEASLG